MIVDVIIGLEVALIVAGAWGRVCNSLTYRDRQHVLRIVSDGNFIARLRHYHNVSYDQHLWARFFFRNPWKLYPAQLRTLIDAEQRAGEGR